jgi:hypothetical protein
MGLKLMNLGRDIMNIGFIIAIVLGGVLIIVAGRNIFLGRKSQNWPTTPGTVLYTGMETYQSRDEDGSLSTTYGATIQYSYEIGGTNFQGNRRTFTEVKTSSRRRVGQILERYPQGSAVSVYYDPNDPANSVLETGVGWSGYLFLALGVIVFLVGLVGLFGLFG